MICGAAILFPAKMQRRKDAKEYNFNIFESMNSVAMIVSKCTLCAVVQNFASLREKVARKHRRHKGARAQRNTRND